MNGLCRLSILLVVVTLLAMICQPAMASGIGIGPNEITINQATRGGTYDRTLTLFNPGENGVNVNVRTDGVAGDWINLYRFDDRQTPITEMFIPAKSNSQLVFRAIVPSDTPTGTYQARIIAETRSEEVVGGVGTVLRARSTVTIHVTGAEIVSGNVETITVADTETGVPLVINTRFRNTGNVIVTPDVHTTIKTNGNVVGEAKSSEKQVIPDTSEAIMIEWDTDGMEPGTYTASVVAYLRGQTIASQEVDFEIFPYGQLSRDGKIDELKYEGMMRTGTPIKLSSIFTNTGRISTRAVLNAEIFKNGNFVNVISGDTVLVPVGSHAEVFSYVTLDEPGDYQIKYWALFEGQRTETKEISLTVSGAEQQAQPQASPLSPISVIVVSMMLILFTTRGRLSRRD